MIDPRRAQLSFGDKLIAEEVDGLYEEWMVHADAVLADEAIVMAAYEALAKRHRLSRTRGRRGCSAEVVVRLLVLKHARNWSYAVLEREVRANLIYRKFTRIGMAKMADAKTMGKWGMAVGPEVIKQIHDRVVSIANEKGLTQGAKMPVDTTVVETNIHYPTDSSLLGDGVRVLTRHEEHYQDCRRSRVQAARPQPQREAPRDRDWPRRTSQEFPGQGEVAQGVRQSAQFHEPGTLVNEVHSGVRKRRLLFHLGPWSEFWGTGARPPAFYFPSTIFGKVTPGKRRSSSTNVHWRNYAQCCSWTANCC
jgi:hypothetical protein